MSHPALPSSDPLCRGFARLAMPTIYALVAEIEDQSSCSTSVCLRPQSSAVLDPKAKGIQAIVREIPSKMDLEDIVSNSALPQKSEALGTHQ